MHWIFLVAALMRANSCAWGNGGAPESGTPAAWDGLGAAATEDAQSVEPQPREHVQARQSFGAEDRRYRMGCRPSREVLTQQLCRYITGQVLVVDGSVTLQGPERESQDR
jgi:hypothetical protein